MKQIQMTKIQNSKKKNRGFTLLEVLLAISVFLLLLTAVGYLMTGVFKTQRVIFSQLTAQKEARLAVENFVKEFRRAAYSSIGAYPLETASAGSIVFYSDIDGDTYREKVRYFLNGSDLKKAVVKPAGQPLGYNPADEVLTTAAKDIISPQIFSYYDGNYDGASPPLSFPVDLTAVRLVKIQLTIEQDPNVSPSPLTVSSQAEMRNLKE